MRKKKRKSISKLQKKRNELEHKKRYGKNWNTIRKLVYKRDGYKCVACGKHVSEVKKLNAHHILLLRVSQTNDTRNLITLCDSCHRKIENKALSILKNGGHRFEVVRATWRYIAEQRQKRKILQHQNKLTSNGKSTLQSDNRQNTKSKISPKSS